MTMTTKSKTFLTSGVIRRFAFVLLGAGALLASPSCSKDKADVSDTVVTGEEEACDEARPDEMLSDIARSFREANASRFASMCSYPIAREYPLRDISDSAMMVKYFPIMFDDSVRAVYGSLTPADWQMYGWRGWSPENGNELWLDGKIYAINYHSRAEEALRAILANDEMATLDPEMRKGWIPAFCLYDVKDSTIYRCDFESTTPPLYNDEGDDDSSSRRYRLAVYPRHHSLRGKPKKTFHGKLNVEGSAGIRWYIFTAPDGTELEYSPDMASLKVIVTAAGDSIQREHDVTRAYWRDYVTKFD